MFSLKIYLLFGICLAHAVDTINSKEKDRLRIILYIWLENIRTHDSEGIHVVAIDMQLKLYLLHTIQI